MNVEPVHFTATSYLEGRRRIVALNGELDVASAPVAEEALRAQFDVLDLSRLDFMDSGGVRILLRVCRTRPGPLIVRGAGRAVRRILDLTGVSDLLVYEDARADQIRSPPSR
jgi:anti-sigma B factor antagonist